MIRILMTLLAIALGLGGCSTIPKLLSSRPMQFTCPGIEPFLAPYDHRTFAKLQKYAFPRAGEVSDTADHVPAALDERQLALEAAVAKALLGNGAGGGKYLLLSGGGQWGAFGAGFLKAQPAAERDWAVITGVSTGAIQTLFAGANRYDTMADRYSLTKGNPASSNGWGIIVKGSEHDMSKLRDLLQSELYHDDDEDNLLEAIVKNDAQPQLLIAMVEGRSTDLIIVRLSDYVRAHLSPKGKSDKLTQKEVGDCVTGLTLASSSIPFRLTPVQIRSSPEGEYRTYMDGGVRLSVIDTQAFESNQTAKAMGLCKAAGLDAEECNSAAVGRSANKQALAKVVAPIIFAVRNGPTIIPPGKRDGDRDSRADIDVDPDAYTTAIRGYSILVNQNELASVAEMLARYPEAEVNFVSADGYDWMTKGTDSGRDKCPARDEEIYFDKVFMQCLVAFGDWRFRNVDAGTNGWSVVGPLTKEQGLLPGTAGILPPLPSDDAFDRAAVLLKREARR